MCREFCDRTRDYWMDWVRRLSISYDWQEPIIRAAISLKLSNFEETGGIVAAHTTSIPEAPGSGRTWDYRFCWLRDAYFVVKALNRIGATQTMEDFISFILGIAANQQRGAASGLQHRADRLDGRDASPSSSRAIAATGRCASATPPPCRTSTTPTAASSLRRMPMFFDQRLPRPGDEALFRLLETLGDKAAELALKPDSGIWEFRGRRRVHTHSAAMCWAGISRLAAIASRLGFADRAAHWNAVADRLQATLLEQAWNPKLKAFSAAFGTDDIDASVLLLPELGLIEADDPRFISTVAAVERELLREKHVMRYANSDDFGMPETAFLICRFWLIDAWWSIGRREEARDLFLDALRHRNRYGLLSEDIHPQTGALWGNFPQTYSMAGLILTAMRLSRSWEDRYWRG